MLNLFAQPRTMKHLKSDAKFIAKYNSSFIYVSYLGEFQSAVLTKMNTAFFCLERIHFRTVFCCRSKNKRKERKKERTVLLHRSRAQTPSLLHFSVFGDAMSGPTVEGRSYVEDLIPPCKTQQC